MSDLQTPEGKDTEETSVQTPKGSNESEEEVILPSTEPKAVADGELEPVDTIVIKDGESYRQMKVFSVKKANELSFFKPANWWDHLSFNERTEIADRYQIFTDIDLHGITDKSFDSLDNVDKSQIAFLYMRLQAEENLKQKSVITDKDPSSEHYIPPSIETKEVATESVDCEFCEGKGKVIVEKKGVKECPRCDGEGTVESNEPNQEQISQDETPDFSPVEAEESFIKTLGEGEIAEEAEYQGKQVTLNKPSRNTDGKSKFKVYVKDGDKVKKVTFGDPNMEIKRDSDSNRKSFRARHNCADKKDKTKAGYWSCKMWQKGKSVSDVTSGESCGCKEKSMEAYQSFVSDQLQHFQSKANEGESVGLLYGQEVEVDGRKIKGTLAYAGVSLNDRIYLPEELAKGDGKTLPLLLNHSSISGAEMELDRLDGNMRQHLENGRDFKVGEVTLEWIPEELTLYYEGEVTDNFFKKEIDDMNMSVSLGIYYDSDSPSVCNDKCYTVITGAEFREVSLVYHAGFPIATIEEVESGLKSLGESVSKVKSYECKVCKEGGMFEATEQDTQTVPCMSCGKIDWTIMDKSIEAQLLPQLYLPDDTMKEIKIPTVIIGKSEDTSV